MPPMGSRPARLDVTIGGFIGTRSFKTKHRAKRAPWTPAVECGTWLAAACRRPGLAGALWPVGMIRGAGLGEKARRDER